MIETRSFKNKLLLVFKGVCMGAANKVPGVSGGIVAYVGGFYEEFIHSLQRCNKTACKLLLKGKFKTFYTYINGTFLFLLISGMLLSYFSVSKLLDYFLDKKELFVWAAFFGMILGSIYYVKNDIKEWNKKTIFAATIGLLIGLTISFLNPSEQDDHLFFVFICGIISVSGMTLPGLSGSFILMLMGNYVLLLVDAVNALYEVFATLFSGDFSFTYTNEQIRMLQILFIFTLGSVTGLVTLSHLLGYILKQYKQLTTAGILGFIIGTLGVVWPWKKAIYATTTISESIIPIRNSNVILGYTRFLPSYSEADTWWAVLLILCGACILVFLDTYGRNKKETG